MKDGIKDVYKEQILRSLALPWLSVTGSAISPCVPLASNTFGDSKQHINWN